MSQSLFAQGWQWLSTITSSIIPTSYFSTYIPSFISRWIQQIKDSYYVITQKDQFIFKQLTERALNNEDGYAKVDVGIFGLRLATVLVVTGKDLIIPTVDYGNWKSSDPSVYDPQARKPFERFMHLIGTRSIVNNSDESVKQDHKLLVKYINHDAVIQFAERAIDDMLDNWCDHVPMHIQVRTCVNRVIAKIMLGIEDVPIEATELIGEAEHALFHYETYPKEAFDALKTKLKTLSDQVVEQHIDTISNSDNFLREYLHTRDLNTLKANNPLGSLIVEGNLTTLMMGALHIAHAQPKHLLELKTKVHGKPRSSLDEHMKDESLKDFYHECLRYFAPNPPIVRFASKQGVIKSRKTTLPISANTHIFVPTRAIMHADQLWDHPEVFDPSRHRDKSRSNFYPLVPFSIGTRICPASKRLVEHMIKYMMLRCASEHDFVVDNPMEQVPVNTASPRFKQTYYMSRAKPCAETFTPRLSHQSQPTQEAQQKLDPFNGCKTTPTPRVAL